MTRARFRADHREEIHRLGLPSPSEPPPASQASWEAQAKQRAHFDETADRRDRFSWRAFSRLPFWRAQDELTFAEWRRLIRPGSLLLDVGAADGRTTFLLADLGIEIAGFDISPKLVRRAVDRTLQAGLADRVTFFVGDADALPLADESVDYVLAYGVLHHLPDPRRSVREFGRVLRPGGLYLGTENNTTPLRRPFDWLMQLKPEWVEEASTRPVLSQAELRSWARASGLELEARTSVFVPPHLCNRIGPRWARRVLRASDAVLTRLPVIRNWGGLIVIRGSRP